MPAASRKSPLDHTGRQAEILAAENAEALAARAGDLTTLTATPTAADNADQADDVVLSNVVEVDQPTVRIRVNTDLPDLIVGYGNHYPMVRGEWYRVPKHVSDHLEEKGYVYH